MIKNYCAAFILFVFCFILLSFSWPINRVAPQKRNPCHVESLQQVLNFPGKDTIRMFSNCGKLLLDHDIDMEGNVYIMPDDVLIQQENGACFKNGIIIGNNNKIASSSAIFDKVQINGRWNINKISTSLFKDLNYINSLRDVLALTDSTIKNVVTIEDADYWVSTTAYKAALLVKSNTTIKILGSIHLIPNDNIACYVIGVHNSRNVNISGGAIWGDRTLHKGEIGEWGMGINISNAHNVKIKNVKVLDCWGDCIYVGNVSTGISIIHCDLTGGRRQGISITDGSDIQIDDCVISNIGGTPPGCGIDIETNKDCNVSDITINNCKIEKCVCGIELNGHAKNSSVSGIIIKNCKIYEISDSHSIVCYYMNNAKISNCKVDMFIKYPVHLVHCHDVYYKEIKRKILK